MSAWVMSLTLAAIIRERPEKGRTEQPFTQFFIFHSHQDPDKKIELLTNCVLIEIRYSKILPQINGEKASIAGNVSYYWIYRGPSCFKNILYYFSRTFSIFICNE